MFGYRENSRLLAFINRLVDVFFLNLLWLAFCLPIVTIGAATAAAHYVTLKMVDDEEGPIARSFVKAFKDNFKRGTQLWLLNAAALYALYLDWQIVAKSDSPSILLVIASILSSAFVFCAFAYSYALAARYDNSLRRTMQNSIRICTRYFLKTLLLLVLMAFEVALFFWNGATIVVGILVGPMVLVYTISGIAKAIFKDIEGKGDREGIA